MSTPRMAEQEWSEHQRRTRISKSKTGVRSALSRETGTAYSPQGTRRPEVTGGAASSPSSQSFFVPGRLPGANDIIRKHHMVYSRLKSEWGLTIARCILVAKLKRMGYCRIEFVWHEANNRRDDDNVIFAKKFVLDALRDTKIIKDDRRTFIHSVTDRVIVDPAKPGVEVTLIPVYVVVT